MPGDEHWEFTVTVPKGTPITAPVTQLTTLPVRVLVSASWTIPQGPSGTLGWRFLSSGVQVIPVNKGAWLIRDGSADASELARLPDSGDWTVQAYNTGANPHTIYVTYYAAVIRPAVPVPPVPFGLDELQQGYNSPLAHPARAKS
jgi:hypothetical protein